MRRFMTLCASAALYFGCSGAALAAGEPPHGIPLDTPTLIGGAIAAVVAALAWGRKLLKGWSADGATIETIQLLREEVTRLSGVNSQLAQEVGRLHDQNIKLQGEIEQLHRRLGQIAARATEEAHAST